MKFSCVLKGLALVVLLLQNPTGIAAEPSAEKPVISIGVFDTFSPEFWPQTLGPSLEYLREKLPEYQFKTVELDPDQARNLKQFHLDFFFSSPVLFWSVLLKDGAVPVAMRQPASSRIPQKSSGAAVIALAGRTDINTPASLLNGKGAVRSQIFNDEYLAFQDWIQSNGIDRSKIKVNFVGWRNPGVLSSVLSGSSDFGILPYCEYEKFERNGAFEPGQVKVVSAKPKGNEPCIRTTDLYPNLVLAALPNADNSLVSKVAQVLYGMPALENGDKWRFASDFTKTDKQSRALGLGHYSYLHEWSFDSLWRRFSTEILLLIGLGVGIFLHIVRVNRLVFIRTRHLDQALKEQKELRERARENSAKLAALEKMGIVSQMSSMIAHELKQPLGAIYNYSAGLAAYYQNHSSKDAVVSEVLAKIQKQARNASDVIEYVRSFARKDASSFSQLSPCSLRTICEAAIETYRLSHDQGKKVALLEGSHGNGPAGKEIPSSWNAIAEVDPKGLELAIYNLIKNGLEAGGAAAGKNSNDGHSGSPVEVFIEESRNSWNICVRNSGKVLSDEEMADLGKPLKTSKSDGLGIGLIIVRNIVEKCSGSLKFQRRPEGGLTAIISLPKLKVNNDQADC